MNFTPASPPRDQTISENIDKAKKNKKRDNTGQKRDNIPFPFDFPVSRACAWVPPQTDDCALTANDLARVRAFLLIYLKKLLTRLLNLLHQKKTMTRLTWL